MKEIISRASQKIVARLTWHTAHKDQAGITKDLADGKDVSEVYGIGEAGLFDEFFFFLDSFKIFALFNNLDPKLTKRNSNINFSHVILIYIMRIISGLEFFWHTRPVLLRSNALMRLVGFNGRQIREGTSNRGVGKSDDLSTKKDDKKLITIRGPICPDSISAYIQAIAASALERFFNSVISILAKNSFFPKKIHALLDASEIQSTEKCKGCGKVTKEKAPALKNRKSRIRKVMETVFGFKIWVIWDPNSKIPIAIRFTTIEVHDIQMAKEVTQQAIQNLGDNAKITSIAFDRGFLDGIFMWWLNKKEITFFVPAKTNLNVYNDALSIVNSGIRKIRNKKRSVGYGKNKKTVIDNWDVVGIEGLTSAGFYSEHGSGSHENRKDFISNPINAVVVLNDPYKENNPNIDTLVILTNGSVNKPLKVYDGYDDRSEIENSVFREAKQSWFIERPAKNTAQSFRAHVYLTIITMALTTAFRTWLESQDKLEQEGKETGIRKYREQIRQENKDKLIIFDEDRYAIFEAYEVLILCGKNVLKPRGFVEKISKKAILEKYGVQLE